MINAAPMPQPPTRAAGAARPRVPQPHRAVSTTVQHDVRVQPVHSQHLGAGVNVLAVKRLDAIERPRRLGFSDDDGTVAGCEGEVGDCRVGAGRRGPEGGVRLGADDGGDVVGVGWWVVFSFMRARF